MYHAIVYPVIEEKIESELYAVVDSLPEWRRKIALSYKHKIDQYLCAKAYLLLKELLYIHYGIYEDVEFELGPYKKPALKSYPGIYFNFSHCKKAVLCAVGDYPLGVDVEEIQFDHDLMQDIFSYSECKIIQNSSTPPIKFTELWTQKESFLKLSGIGLIDNLKDILNNIQAIVEFKTEINEAIGVVSTIATFR